MQVGLIADIHGNAMALDAVISALALHRVDHILVAGDMIGYYPFVNEVIDLLRSQQITPVLGNHECYFIEKLPVTKERWRSYQLDYAEKVMAKENKAWLSNLMTEQCFEMGGLRFHLCHGSPWAIDEYVYPDSKTWARFSQLEADVVVLGHTHIPAVRQEGNVVIVNPGSCGQPRDYRPGACYGILNTEEKKVSLHRIAYDLDGLVEKLQSMGSPPALIQILLREK